MTGVERAGGSRKRSCIGIVQLDDKSDQFQLQDMREGTSSTKCMDPIERWPVVIIITIAPLLYLVYASRSSSILSVTLRTSLHSLLAKPSPWHPSGPPADPRPYHAAIPPDAAAAGGRSESVALE